MSFPRRQRQQRPRSAGTALNPLTLATPNLAENTGAGVVISTVLGKTGGSALSLADDAGGRFALSGTSLVAGATATDYESSSTHTITLRETLAGATNSPRDSVLTLTVVDVDETPAGFALNGSTNAALKAMLAAVAGGTGRGKIVMKGDSTTAGAGGAIVSGTGDIVAQLTGARAYRPSAVLAAELSGVGYPALDNAFVGDSHSAPYGVTLNVYDPRVSFTGAVWGISTVQSFAGGGYADPGGAASGSILEFTPSVSVNAFEILAYNVGGALGFAIDEGFPPSIVAPGATVVGNVVTMPSSNDGFSRITIPAGSTGTHKLGIVLNSGTPLISGARGYATGTEAIEIINHAGSGATSADQAAENVGGFHWSNNDQLGFEAPDLTIVNLGLNDAAAGVSTGTYTANLQAIIDKARLTGDVLLVSPHPAASSFASTATQTALRDAAAALAASNAVTYMDLYSYFGDFASIASRLADGAVHPNRGMYAEIGKVYRQCIEAMAT